MLHRLAHEPANLTFVSVIRNGLDIVTSRMPGHSTKAHEYWCSIQRYVDSVHHILSFQHERHMIVRYEDLVTSPATVIQAIHAHAGISLDDGATVSWQPLTSHHPEASATPALTQSITTERIGRWQSPEHAECVAEFMARDDARRLLVDSGYDLP